MKRSYILWPLYLFVTYELLCIPGYGRSFNSLDKAGVWVCGTMLFILLMNYKTRKT